MADSYKSKNFKNYQVAIYSAILITAALLIFFIFHNKDNVQEPNHTRTTTSTVSTDMQYPAGWQPQGRLTAIEKSAGVVSVALHSDPNGEVTIRVDDSPLAKNFSIQKTSAEVISRLKNNLANFKLVSKAVTTVGKNQALTVTYDESNGQLIYRQTQVIVPTPNKTFYLTASSLNSDFRNLTGIDSITNAFAGYIAKHQ